MKHRLLVSLAIVLLASFASAATFSLTLTAAQVSAIQYAYSVAPDKGTQTAQEWFAAQIGGGLIAQYASAQKEAKHASFCTKFSALTQVAQDSVCTSVGLAAGCDPCAK